MALSWENYLVCVEHFLSVSSALNDGWSFIEKFDSKVKNSPENCYLLKKTIERYETKCRDSEEASQFEENMEFDASTLQESTRSQSETLVWEYHILYSLSYSVPVLYFNVRNSGGKLLPLDEVWKILNVSEEVLVEKWSFVSQQEHPILLRPFFTLHPCKSFEFLKVGESSSINPLVTWLSSIAHIVHLSLSLEYGNIPFHS